MREVAIIGAGMIPFGRRDEDTLMDMLAFASLKALDDAGLGDQTVDAVYVGNMGGGIIQHQSAIASSLVDRLSLLPAAAETVENGPASGGSAVKNGVLAVASGYYDTVLVVGGEKMREVTGWRATDFVATMTHPTAEYPYGITLPGMAGMFTRLYMEKYGVTREHLVAVALKNQEMGTHNPYAHVEMALSREGIYESPAGDRQQSHRCRPAAPLRCLPGERWRGGDRHMPIGKAEETGETPGGDRWIRPGYRYADAAGARGSNRAKSGHPGSAESVRYGQTQAIRYPRRRAARCLHHPGDRRERARRLLQEGRGR